MAIAHLNFNDSLPHGQLLRAALTHLEEGHDALNDVVAAMQMMIDGDGSDPAHFNEVMTRFAFSSIETSKAAWDELNSLRFKLNTNESVPDVVAALVQAFNKFR